MAPRSAKGKKAADVKVTENEAPKRGRGKKNVEELEPEVEIEENEKSAPVTEKKTKRSKKASNEANTDEQNGKTEVVAPPSKKGKKKNIEEPIPDNDNSTEDETPAEESEPIVEDEEENGHMKETQPTSGKGRKKQLKKDSDKTEQKSGRGRKPKQDTETAIETDIEEKPKSGRGRGRKAQPKADVQVDEVESDKSEMVDEEIKPELATKGRKKGPGKTKETPETVNKAEEVEEPIEEPKKKETKGRKNQSKKAQAKEEAVDDEVKEDEPATKKRKVTKKEEDKHEEAMEEEKEISETKPTKGRRGQKKAVEVISETTEEPQDTGEPTTKRRRKAAEDKAPTEDAKKKPPPKNKATTNYEDIDFSNTSKNSQGKDWNFKIASWNVDGIRAWMNKGGLDYIKYEKPDILCLQEVKCAQDKLPDEIANVPGYHAYWLCSDKDGYAGVGIYTTRLAMNVQYGLQNEELDNEGRVITAEYEHFYLICTYVPNAGRKLVTLPKRLQWNEEFRKYVKELDKKKPVIICGDMNVSHNEIDLANPKTNRKNAGFTEEERSGMTDLLGDGFVDTYRHLNPDKTGAYTFWTYMMNSRSKNVGWRLDYFILSERLLPSMCDNVIRNEVYGSDHCPITLFLHLTSADKPKE